ncbi:hypothetical protein NECID01_1469 [Nematocida sp. AWRm77]|nr:hypothetical protein NECID01_1469 [Nematocida sp. AWRm77]
MHPAAIKRILLGLCVCVPWVLARSKGHNEKGKYDYELEGYLFNVGERKFLGAGSTKNERTYIKAVSNPKKAMLLTMPTVYYDKNIFTMIVSANSYSEDNEADNKGAPHAGYETFNLIGGWGYKQIGLEADNTTITHRFALSAPAYANGQGFRIHIYTQCIGIDGNDDLVMEECKDSTGEEGNNQLWRWINRHKYEEDSRKEFFNYRADVTDNVQEQSMQRDREDHGRSFGPSYNHGDGFGREGRYGMPPDSGSMGYRNSRYGPEGGYNSHSDPYGNHPDPYGNHSDPYGNHPDPYGNHSDPYGRDSGGYNRGGNSGNPSTEGKDCSGEGCNYGYSPYTKKGNHNKPGDPRYFPYYSRGTCEYCDHYD